MPTTRLKNAEYRLLLPFLAPSPGKEPLIQCEGHPVQHQSAFLRLIRRHHVLGSATLIDDGAEQALLLTRSLKPSHIPEPDTLFRVASITKIATSVVAMRMTEEGLLSLDSEILPLLPAERGLEILRGITLRQLLSHTSGLLDPETLEKDLNEGKPLPETLKSVKHLDPGSGFHYSNLGYGMLGCIMESVLNKPVGAIFDEWLFRPLGMRASLGGYSLPTEKIMPVTRVLFYHEGRDVVLTPLGSRPLTVPDPMRHFGYTAGSMYIDIRSLRELMRMLLLGGNGFLKEASVQEMCREHVSYGKLSPTLSYGLGLLRVHDPSLAGHDLIGHQGFAYGCVDGAFWEEGTERLLLFLNGGCSEARAGRLGIANRDMARWAFRKELKSW